MMIDDDYDDDDDDDDDDDVNRGNNIKENNMRYCLKDKLMALELPLSCFNNRRASPCVSTDVLIS